jgi:hypothetical protein
MTDFDTVIQSITQQYDELILTAKSLIKSAENINRIEVWDLDIKKYQANLLDLIDQKESALKRLSEAQSSYRELAVTILDIMQQNR